ncbi:MAG: diacylglycerol kinase family lipid kinase [Gemmatimonadaceae bacterium]|nr:diacylglycerol kinase family lipid kinase [Gemmatimonadaceae bacterium]
MEDAIFVIANPAAGGGRGAKVLDDVLRATSSRRDVVVRMTTGPGDETKLAQRAVARGAGALIAVGGDGTWSKVAAALLESERRPPLALIAAGMGNDFAKTVGAPARDIQRTLELIDSGETRRVDVGTVEGRFFLVCCGFGFDTAVLQRMQTVRGLRGLRGLRGSTRYVYAALRELPGYPGFEVSLAGGAGSERPSDAPRRLLLLVIANAQHYGGAFKIAPNADLSDGLLDAIALAPRGTLARAGLLLSATRGAHVRSPAVTEYQQPWFDLKFAAQPMYNLDGDLYQARSRILRVECLPAALEVFAHAVG